MRHCRAFTLIEITISVFILLLLLLLAVPSLNGVLADRRLRRSLDNFNKLVQQAQQLSIEQHRPYLLVWHRADVELRPEAFAKGEEKKAKALLPIDKRDTLVLKLPAALAKESPPEWIFWPSGNCEPAIVEFKGKNGYWTADYSPLNARAELTRYAAK